MIYAEEVNEYGIRVLDNQDIINSIKGLKCINCKKVLQPKEVIDYAILSKEIIWWHRDRCVNNVVKEKNVNKCTLCKALLINKRKDAKYCNNRHYEIEMRRRPNESLEDLLKRLDIK